jgi:hypothetical protein
VQVLVPVPVPARGCPFFVCPVTVHVCEDEYVLASIIFVVPAVYATVSPSSAVQVCPASSVVETPPESRCEWRVHGGAPFSFVRTVVRAPSPSSTIETDDDVVCDEDGVPLGSVKVVVELPSHRHVPTNGSVDGVVAGS